MADVMVGLLHLAVICTGLGRGDAREGDAQLLQLQRNSKLDRRGATTQLMGEASVLTETAIAQHSET